MGKILLMGDKYTASLFRMVGTEAQVVEDPFNLQKEIDNAKKRGDVDLILITRDLYEPVKEKLETVISNQTKPLITVIPSPFSESKPMDVRRMILRALGFG
ncbi:MAG: vacuolar H+-transporting two-sector ATPase, F subunit [Candidatus Aramenus sulfurataquae]|jgi:V/A-type H+-transporting ATPase subunit F|uniref:ATP synthase subunit F n=2 Tax=Candidatus Aramenus sulfurataquae TaxID=1326980 RepID=W7KKV3_9CREN|nr:MAG: vacuolar H+-transporting two-sector ATPase, F subunit [Candidatus Aramenus sulfurataquae]MCL7343152.1 V-type ATP synthase subunit F [Candidatus Aramenus sulfurataquae]